MQLVNSCERASKRTGKQASKSVSQSAGRSAANESKRNRFFVSKLSSKLPRLAAILMSNLALVESLCLTLFFALAWYPRLTSACVCACVCACGSRYSLRLQVSLYWRWPHEHVTFSSILELIYSLGRACRGFRCLASACVRF